jgi:XTP/dITP diphosphohydrolase
MMHLWIATTNSHKIKEFKNLIASQQITLHTPDELPTYFAPPETGKTFYENARIKARSLHAVKPDQWVMAEDSGISCDGLNGTPGIHSARYAGDKASDSENTQKLLHMLKIRSPTNRKATYTASIVLYSPDKEEFKFEAEFKGTITENLRGTAGFGYDPIFIPEGETKTVGELGDDFKTKHSHRAQVARKLFAFLKERGLV